MLRLLGRRLVSAVPLVLVVAFAVFVLVQLSPTDVARTVAGDQASPEQVEAVRQELGIDQPLIQQYVGWLRHAVTGDLGTSYLTDRSVVEMLVTGGGVTLSLIVLALLLSTTVGVTLGVVAASRPNGWADRYILMLASVALAVPGFWLGLMLVMVFSLSLGWLPAVGYVPFADAPGQWLVHLVLPATVLSLLPGAEITRQLRGAMVDVLRTDYVLAARARGVPRSAVLWKLALKNAAAPVVTIAGYRTAQMIGTAVVVEHVFALNGLGTLAIGSAISADLPAVLGIVVISLLVVILINVIVDLSYGWFNPKVRVQ